MAFETSVLRDGAWVTERVDFQAALDVYAPPTKSNSEEVSFGDHPPCGILSRTVIESPVVNSVHSVRLRSRWKNDIAFIGDRYVQISELRSDGQLHNVLRVTDFGARIRNSTVLGTGPIPTGGAENGPSFGMDDDVKLELLSQSERVSINMREDKAPSLPPQLLLLILETGDILFAFIQLDPITNALRLVTSKIPPPGNIPYFGNQFVVDPSGRYLAVSSLDDTLVIHLLKPWKLLNEEFKQHGRIMPVMETSIRVVNGNIQNITFLFPSQADEFHIILALTVFSRKRTNNQGWMLFVHEWELGDDLLNMFAKTRNPVRFPEFSEFPYLLIPIKFGNAFFILFQHFIGLCKQSLSAPEYEFTMLHAPGPSKHHHGTSYPLWTTWAKPFRRESYSQATEIIYLVREDGFLEYIELESSHLMFSVTDVGFLNTHVSLAFTVASNGFSDLLIIGGDSGPGARQEPEKIMAIPNWSPVVDATTTDLNTSLVSVAPANQRGDNSRGHKPPDRIFLASGRGATGSVTEIRHGIQARIGLDLELGEPVRQVWLFSDDRLESGSMVAILALPYSTAILSFSSNLEDVVAEPADQTPFDSTARTLCSARIVSDVIIQVTEETITIVTHSQSSQHRLKELCGLPEYIPQRVFSAHQFIVLSRSQPQGSELRVLRVEEMNVIPESCWETPGEDSCISLLESSGECYLLLGEMIDSLPSISIYSMDGNLVKRQGITENTATTQNSQSSLEALTSIVVAKEQQDYFVAIAGTRCGRLITFQIPKNASMQISWRIERLGNSPVEVFPYSNSDGAGAGTPFLCYDNNAVQLGKYCPESNRFKSKTTIWPTDMSDSSLQVPPIHSVFEVGSYQGDSAKYSMLAMVAGTRMLIADLSGHSSSIPRSIPVDGTPTRILYSDVWKCLVVGYQVENKPSIAFIDPDTGDSISKAIDKDRNACEFITGLGQADDRIFGLQEWLYMKNGEMFPFIIVTTQSGGLLIVSVREERKRKQEGGTRQLQHWTRYRKKGFKVPIYSVVPDQEGLVYCAGRTLYWDVLDLAEKKMKTAKSFELDSPATSLSISNGKIWALTSMHSLQIVDHRSDPGLHDMKLLHIDRATRTTSHMISVGPTTQSDLWPVTLLSDVSGGIAGVWVPWDKRNQELVAVFEGQLGNSVRRFIRAKCRPTWLLEGHTRPRYGCIQSTADGAEILGVSLDGSMRHFTLLQQDLRRFLYLVQSLWRAEKSARYPHEQLNTLLQAMEHPKSQHIDGDVLIACLDQRLLERLVHESGTQDLFRRYLDELEGGLHTRSFGRIDTEESMDLGLGDDLQGKYMRLGYDILDYVLAPVL
ncbi:unnamed protein product [Clonostachys rhizophaga]|uniref:RSE1/DDB1/CPSF1 first beta-propeller domain-containing protein n=1 Tax=Clonostachys rhizophaga TaxID=160324 RepID=A0A9N9VER2_9HYPO|nr:unnamed protein product [Clonostachys rhizophaga]